MRVVEADFNARTADDRVRLTTRCSQKSLDRLRVDVGDWVWLTDGEIRVGARIESKNGEAVARPAWETLEHLVSDSTGAPPPEVVEAGLRRLRRAFAADERDYRDVLRVLPAVQEHLPGPGRADYLRSRAAQAFGHPELALLAADEALAKEPGKPFLAHHRLMLLKEVDLERAVEEVETLAEQAPLPAILASACAGVLHDHRVTLHGEEAKEVDRSLLRLTYSLDEDSSEPTPSSVLVGLHVVRGYSFSHLGQREAALAEFSEAIEADPLSAEARTARGVEAYPSQQAVQDLGRAIELGALTFWPAYLLTHHAASTSDWEAVRPFADLGLRLGPPTAAASDLVQWRAIARHELGDRAPAVRADFEEALRLAPQSEHAKRNYEAYEAMAGGGASPQVRVRWLAFAEQYQRGRAHEAAA